MLTVIQCQCGGLRLSHEKTCPRPDCEELGRRRRILISNPRERLRLSDVGPEWDDEEIVLGGGGG